MIQEIYSLSPGDPRYQTGILEIHNERDVLVSEILMILNTECGEVLGDMVFGGSLEDLLFEFNYNENQIISKLQEQINNYCQPDPNYTITLSVKFFQGSVRDGAIIDIFINGVKSVGLFVK